MMLGFMSIYKSHTNHKLNFGLAAQEQHVGVLRPGLCQDVPNAMGMAQTSIRSVLEEEQS